MVGKLTTCLLFVIVFLVSEIKLDEVDDYMALIAKGVVGAASYPRRTNNEDLYPETASNIVKDFGLFDFVVIGAGSAGAIVAKRLSENKLNVLLLEAGDYETDYTDIPAMFRQLQFSDYNWGYYTSPQNFTCQAMIDKKCPFSRGKCIGGTSTINGIIYARGNPIDQELWRQFGITGWSWREVLPYFKRLENISKIYGDENLHGYNGPIPIDYSRPKNNLEDIFLNANQEMYTVSKDYNGKIYMASGAVHFNKNNGKRASTGRCYLNEYNSRYLSISTKSYAYKIIINAFNRAVGVEFMKNNTRYRAYVKSEIILSAGAVNSPQLLMLSGIGPKEELNKHQIPLVQDLPVGKNLEDHLGFHALQFKSDLKVYDRTKPLREMVTEYLQGIGPLANIPTEGLSFLSTDNSLTYPDIEAFISSRAELNVTIGNEFNFNKEALDIFSLTSEEVEYCFRISLVLIHPKSKGTVTLQSNNPRDFPIVNPNSLSDPDDVDRIYKAIITYVNKLVEAKAFKDINTQLLKRILPDCVAFEYLSEEYWKCMIKHISTTANHPVGTCRMGSGVDSVVDSRMKVHGVRSLRVVDLSVAPRVNSGHSNALAMMIGEKAADLIKEDYWLQVLLSNLFPGLSGFL